MIQIKEFQFDSNLWRLDWPGRLSYPQSVESEPEISVYFSQLRTDYANVLANDALALPLNHQRAKVKVGQLPFLQIGSVWSDGISIPRRRTLPEVDLTLHHSQIDLVRFGSHIQIDGVSQPVLPAKGLRIGLEASREVAGSWLAVAYDPTPNLRFVVIPSFLLFQNCLVTSPKAIRRLVYGQLDKLIDSGSGFLVGKPDTYYVNLYQDFANFEAPALANLDADPIGEKQYSQFRNALIVATANFDKSRPEEPLDTHIKLGLPFSNPVDLKVRGKYLPVQNAEKGQPASQWGFLVTEIVDLKVQLAFDHLIVGRKNNSKQGSNAGDPNLPFAFGPREDKTPTSEAEPQQLTSGQDPEAYLEKLSLEACRGFQPKNLNIVTEGKEVQKYRAWPVKERERPDFEGGGTTGDPHESGSGLAEVGLVLEPVPKPPVSLNLFLETLQELAKQGFPFRTIEVTTTYRKVGDYTVNYLPRVLSPTEN
jgi:hypothetical protein